LFDKAIPVEIYGGSITTGSITAGSKSLLLRANTGNITLNSGTTLSSSASGNAITLAAAGNFINNAGSGALSTPNGRWIMYSTSAAGNTLGGLTAPQTINGQSYASLPPSSITTPTYNATQNTFVYSAANTLRFTANSLNRFYGDTNPVLTYSFWCSTGCTESAAVTGLPSLSTTAVQGSDVGTYAISIAQGGLALTSGFVGSTFEFVNGVLTLNPRVLTAALQGTVSKTYDRSTTASLAAGNYSLSNIYGSDDVTLNNPSAGTYDTANVGTGKTVSVTGLTLSGAKAANYTLAASAVNGTVGTITAKALTITANGKAMTYGDGNSFNGYSSSGLVAGDAISAVDLATNASLSGAGQWNAGSWLISAANASGTGLGNYSIAYNNGTLSVGKRSLGGVVNNQTLTYGAATPSYGKNDVTWNAGDFYGSDDVASLTSATIDLGGYAQGSNAGSYTLAATGLSATNYQLGSVTPGILTVTGGTTDGDILPRPSVPNTVQWVTQNTFMMPTGSVDNAELMFTNQANDNQSTISSNGNSDESTMIQSNDNKKSKISYDALLMLNIDPLLAQNLGIKREFLKRFTMPGRKTQLNHNNLSETILAWAS
jgi:hypothetical protein